MSALRFALLALAVQQVAAQSESGVCAQVSNAAGTPTPGFGDYMKEKIGYAVWSPSGSGKPITCAECLASGCLYYCKSGPSSAMCLTTYYKQTMTWLGGGTWQSAAVCNAGTDIDKTKGGS